MRAVLNQVRISPKKVSLIAGMFRGESAEKSLEILKYMPKKGAQIMYKLLASAVANAENNHGQSKGDLAIAEILVGAGPTYRRGQSHSKGRVTKILKRTTNLTIELTSNV